MTLRTLPMCPVLLLCALGTTPRDSRADDEAFDHACAWATFDPGAAGVGNNTEGYWGAACDGRYIYFAPFESNTAYHGEVLRFDTAGDFADVAAWTSYDAGVHGVGTNPDGYAGAVFDGRYVYFVPYRRANGYHGEVLRYDTTGGFDDVTSWAAFDAGAHGVGTRPDGYRGAVFDGRFVYFVPCYTGFAFHGEVLRLDTSGDFMDVSAWSTYDPGRHGVGTDPDGYSYGVFDGRYVYFSPYHNGSSYHGEVLRYDTTGPFDEAASWITFDAGANGVGDDPDGYPGAVFDGRYVYFVPLDNGSGPHGEVLRYDTTGDFSDVAAWAAFDASQHGIGNNPTGFMGGVYDGRHVYFVAIHNSSGYHDEMLRYDTAGDFHDVASWTAYNPADDGVGATHHGYREGIFHERYVYFVPGAWDPTHGEVLRYDTAITRGDLNCDGALSSFDIDAFVLALQATPPDYSEYYAQYPDCDHTLADCNQDGVVNGFDIDAFVALLAGM
ncbi:MAG: hypothetical protein KKB50_16315 [Planctomycetes bacterium]|nr:hypothetical protein [Planctomycetota bacterium]